MALNWLTTAMLIALVFLDVSPASAMKEIIVDWETGEVIVTEEPVDEAAEESAVHRYIEEVEAAEEKIERLLKAVEIQQKVISRQRSLIKELREELRRKDRMLLGMERLLRRSR